MKYKPIASPCTYQVVSEQELLVVQYRLAVDVLDEDPERLRHVVVLRVELEVALDGELDEEQVARDRLHVPLELNLRDDVDVLVDLAAELREVDQLANLGSVHKQPVHKQPHGGQVVNRPALVKVLPARQL